MEASVSYSLIPVYAAYAAVSVSLTIWIARTLFKNGAVFLEEVFADNPKMAEAVNHLLVVGFYLLNLGYALLLMKMGAAPTAIAALEALSGKLGLLLLSLGGMHFFNLYLFHRIRQRAKVALLPPPVAPQMVFPQPHSLLAATSPLRQ
ncbi:MAG: hypothetical protein MUF34_16240 [Polyangiaceae bacterium]|jgi:hypothetical protein|nr:hypothetical protein [Polyangiaceae bacterium]